MTKIALSALAAVALASSTASAGNVSGYVCNVALHPATLSQSNGLGNEGELLLILNSQPDCGGTQVAYVYFFSVGATYPGTNTTYLYTGAELQATYQALVASRNKPTQRSVGLSTATTNTIQALLVSLQ
jgi:hypothetical protein